jgi:T5orf172 domain
MNNNITESQIFSLYESHQEFPINFDQVWPQLGYSRKGNAKRALQDCGFTERIDFFTLVETGTLQTPRSEEITRLTSACFEKWKLLAYRKQLEYHSKRPIKPNQLYVIGDKKNKVMKVGVSSNPQKRMASIQTNYPWVLDLWMVVDSKCAYKLEAHLHKELELYRLNGEWFDGTAFALIDWQLVKTWVPSAAKSKKTT